jgi:hypothetical protein
MQLQVRRNAAHEMKNLLLVSLQLVLYMKWMQDVVQEVDAAVDGAIFCRCSNGSCEDSTTGSNVPFVR